MFQSRPRHTQCFVSLSQFHWRCRTAVVTVKSCPNRRKSARTVLTATANQPPAFANDDVRIRMACQADIAEMARVTARAFCEQDEMIIFIQTKLGQRFSPMSRTIVSIFETLFEKEAAIQLHKRVGKNQRAHIVLLAEKPKSGTQHHNEYCIGEVMGCVEIGVVPVGEMTGARTSDAIRYWDQSIAALTDADATDPSKHVPVRTIEDASQDNGNDVTEYIINNRRAPYIGNLAVSKKFRRCGVASALVQEACVWAKTLWRAPCVWLHVEECNEAATGLYKKLGFGCESKDPEWIDGVGRRRRLFLRSNGGTQDWTQARLASVKLNGWEYLRWCWLDLKRARKEKEQL